MNDDIQRGGTCRHLASTTNNNQGEHLPSTIDDEEAEVVPTKGCGAAHPWPTITRGEVAAPTVDNVKERRYQHGSSTIEDDEEERRYRRGPSTIEDDDDERWRC